MFLIIMLNKSCHITSLSVQNDCMNTVLLAQAVLGVLDFTGSAAETEQGENKHTNMSASDTDWQHTW